MKIPIMVTNDKGNGSNIEIVIQRYSIILYSYMVIEANGINASISMISSLMPRFYRAAFTRIFTSNFQYILAFILL